MRVGGTYRAVDSTTNEVFNGQILDLYFGQNNIMFLGRNSSDFKYGFVEIKENARVVLKYVTFDEAKHMLDVMILRDRMNRTSAFRR